MKKYSIRFLLKVWLVTADSERVIFMMVEDMLSMMKMIFMAINLTSRVAKERRTRKQSNGEGTAPRYR